MDAGNVILIALSALAVLSVGAWLGVFFTNLLRRIRDRRRFARGRRGEIEAEKFLRSAGYRIIDSQPELICRMWVDGKEVKYRVRADFLVEKKGRRAVVEVKTGNQATNPASANTRRQVFEYSRLYDVDEVLFFDAESASLMDIEFDVGRRGDDTVTMAFGYFRAFVAGLIVGAALIWWFLR